MSDKKRISLPFSTEPEGLPAYVGDALWSNYQAVAEVQFAPDDAENHVTLGIRCAENAQSGFFLRLYADGKWELCYGDELLKDGMAADFDPSEKHSVSIGAIGTLVFCSADLQSLCEMKLDGRPLVRSGKISLQSSNDRNHFFSVTAQALPAVMPSGCYHVETGQDDMTEFRFFGCGISLLGKTEQAYAAFWIDGNLYSERFNIGNSSEREAFFTLEPLRKGWHTLNMQLLEGAAEVTAYEIPTDDLWADYSTEHFPPDSLTTPHRSPDLKKLLPVAGVAAGAAALLLLGKHKKKK